MWEDDEPKPGHLDAVIRSASKKFRSDQLSSWHASICQRYLGPGKFQKILCFEYDTLTLKKLIKVASIIRPLKMSLLSLVYQAKQFIFLRNLLKEGRLLHRQSWKSLVAALVVGIHTETDVTSFTVSLRMKMITD